MNIKKAVAFVGGTVLLAGGLALVAAAPASADTLTPSTNLNAQGWTLKPGVSGEAYVSGGLTLDARAHTPTDGGAWAKLVLPTTVHLSTLSDLSVNLVNNSGSGWGGIILQDGDLTDQLHVDSDGRQWTQQSGIFSAVRAGYFQSWAIDSGGADQPGTDTAVSDPLVGSIEIFVNQGQSATIASITYDGHTQPFDLAVQQVAPPTPPASTAPVAPTTATKPSVSAVAPTHDTSDPNQLADTGTNLVPIYILAAILLLGGGAVLYLNRRNKLKNS